MTQIITLSIKTLILEYYPMEFGQLIEHDKNKFYVYNIDSDNIHNGKKVYISRRAIKHIVESRKKEYLKDRSDKQVLNRILLMIDKIPEIINDYDVVDFAFIGRVIFSKSFIDIGGKKIRIICDIGDEGNLQIKSIHFRK